MSQEMFMAWVVLGLSIAKADEHGHGAFGFLIMACVGFVFGWLWGRIGRIMGIVVNSESDGR